MRELTRNTSKADELVRGECPGASSADERLSEALSRWLELPVYRRHGLRAESVQFQQLPFITKRDMRDGFPGNFLRHGQSLETLLERRQVEVEHTSGTSEERTPVLLGSGWWERQEARALRLNRTVGHVLDEFPQARRVLLTTPVCNGMVCESAWSPMSARTYGNTLSVNHARIPFVIEDSQLARMAGETAAWSPQFLDVDPVHGAWFARYCERNHIQFPSLQFILCSYEFVSAVHRRVLERAFGVPVLNLYGSTETGHLLMQDDHGGMRPSLETAYLEVVDADANGVGDLIVTTLSNDYMPLLRYRIGDLVKRHGCTETASYEIHGRARDALQLPDGRRITTRQVDDCFTDIPGMAHYQLRQLENGRFQLRYIPDGNGMTSRDMRMVTNRLETLLQSSGAIGVEAVPILAPAPSGKFRLTCGK